MTKVRMEHPNLPGQPIYVFPQAAATHNFSGWVEAPEPPPEPKKSPGEGEEPASATAEPAGNRTAEAATRIQPAGRRVVKPTSSTEE